MNERTNNFDTLGYALLLFEIFGWLKANWPWIAGALAAWFALGALENWMHLRGILVVKSK